MTVATAPSLKIDRSAKTLRELSLEKMRAAILDGHFKPGERLVERSLCEQLDVSRSIVREVLRHLEAEGLVEAIPHQGPVVATLSAEQAAQVYEIRALLEGRAARLFAERADAAALKNLVAVNAAIQDAFQAGDHPAVVLHTTAFYEALFAGAGLGMAWDIVRSLNARINRLRLMTIGSPGRQKEAAAEMERILKALRKRDAQAAQDAAEMHVRRVAEIAGALLK
ncbi:GntR family transcriptional regulator [Ramlibacter sp. G-1-2-2]|uniref:GntR family transcriptional regulator n=1 Tax=Ramlibacter agri TaxID=2728837 RepID=A0A848HAR9_9BURK|nr:GntR family transcriptional regulator [Ramlibacter agri]NML47557.1 GntR family transcriptional regulator [Ramlibacter agri]